MRWFRWVFSLWLSILKLIIQAIAGSNNCTYVYDTRVTAVKLLGADWVAFKKFVAAIMSRCFIMKKIQILLPFRDFDRFSSWKFSTKDHSVLVHYATRR